MTAVRCHHQVGTGSREGGKVGTGREIKRKKEEQRETLGEGKWKGLGLDTALGRGAVRAGLDGGARTHMAS